MRLGTHPRLPVSPATRLLARSAGFVALMLSLVVTGTSPAAVIHVPGDQPTIQAGINAAQSGDMVLVAPGTYSGAGNINLSVTKNIAVTSEGGPAVTTIDAQLVGRVFHLSNSLTSAALVEGFSIRNGNTPAEAGGGMLITTASPTIRNCVFTGNAAAQGGGIAVQNFNLSGPTAQPTIENCRLEANGNGGLLLEGTATGTLIRNCTVIESVGRGIIIKAFSQNGATGRFEDCIIRSNTEGGVLFMAGFSGGTFINCEITDHTTVGDGAGVWDVSFEGRPNFDGCLFARNHSAGSGGGAQIAGDQGAAFTNCRFEDNSALSGGGLSHPGGLPPHLAEPIHDCQFINNTATNAGGGLAFSTQASVRLFNNLFWGNTAGQKGGALYISRGVGGVSTCVVASSTMVGNSAPLGAGVSIAGVPAVNPPKLDHTIIAFSGGGPAVDCGAFSADGACTDIFGNSGGDWVGCIASELGVDGNIAADPLFCDTVGGDFHLSDASPCAPAHSGGCDLIGALGAQCGATPVAPSTWGSIKASFHR